MIDPKPIIEVQQLTKVFAGEHSKPGRRQRDFIIALDHISFSVLPGEIVGLIGGNGSGKTTLLRLLAGTSIPTSGQIKISSQPRAILSLGGSLHSQLTARENIYLYGAMLGIRRRELRADEESILTFAGLADVADEPVRQFSLGMRLRLAFAIATSGQPEIMVIDEVIAAGDASWQAAGLQRLRELSQAGTALVIATHDLLTLDKVASTVIWLEQGQIKKRGYPAYITASYKNAT